MDINKDKEYLRLRTMNCTLLESVSVDMSSIKLIGV